MFRAEMFERVKAREKIWDFIIIGGGATGVGCAVDAASRGFDVLLLEQSDFGKGTSSRSTKLVHGGVRYLAQGKVKLVREALRERGILLKNAGHLVRIQSFVVPCYSFWQKFFYGAGLKTYDLLSGKFSFGKSKLLSKKETLKKLPNLKSEDLRGSVIYFDGQFEDARLLINLATTAFEHGATVLNYAKVFELTKNARNKIDGVKFRDTETNQEFYARAKIVINAAGAFSDSVRRLSDKNAARMISASQGIHLVFDKSFLPTENALMIPKTSDGRVLFAIPWQGKTLIGTTDTPVDKIELEPKALEKEIEFILKTAQNYLAKPPRRTDILSIFAGIRPLVKKDNTKNTHALARDHTIEIDESNLLTITGGKWTTYRRMAEDAIDQAIDKTDLSAKFCVTKNLLIHGSGAGAKGFGDLDIYGSDAEIIRKLIDENPHLNEQIHPALPYRLSEIVWAVRFEMACSVEDVLARRTRALFLDARAAIESAPKVAEIMAWELVRNQDWIDEQIQEFNSVAQNYFLSTEL
jgi:glycerol-3-phosphate dehydrogenase